MSGNTQKRGFLSPQYADEEKTPDDGRWSSSGVWIGGVPKSLYVRAVAGEANRPQDVDTPPISFRGSYTLVSAFSSARASRHWHHDRQCHRRFPFRHRW